MRARYRMISTIAGGVLGSIVPQAGFGDGPGVPVASPRITVTGDPTPIETIRTALLAAAPQIVPEAGDARVTLRQTIPSLQPLAAATRTMLRAVFQMAPSGVLPVTRAVPVEINHQVALWTRNSFS